MKKMKTITVFCGFLCLSILSLGNSFAGEKFKPSFQRWYQEKRFFDDPRPVLKNYPLQEIIPAHDYVEMVFNMEEMTSKWEQAIGFKSPDIVGKIAPEIVLGRYSFRDKDEHPGLQELMLPLHYRRFKRGGPPLACNFSQIEVVPTRALQLRAERSGSGDGREYTIRIMATDFSSNSSLANVKIIVPHDQGKK